VAENQILTVRGPLEPAKLGSTLIHEHLLFDLTCYFTEPADDKGKTRAREPIQLNNLGWVRRNSMSSLHNLKMLEEELATTEAGRFRDAGGQAIVDQTINGIAPQPEGLRRISSATGLHIVAGSGYYIFPSHPADMDEKTVPGITDEIVGCVEKGINGTDVRAGLIGEIGASWPLHPNEEKCLHAAARAHLETGAPISIHPGQSPNSPMQVLDLLRRDGVDPERVIMSHVDARFREHIDLYRHLADTGCKLSFDTFARDIYYPMLGRQHPSDNLRVDVVAELVRRGFLDSIMVAQDCCYRMDLTAFGGYGYAHILEHILPRLRAHGVTDNDISGIMVANPARFLAF
jgi:phosphotriesterase-related protein